MIDKIGEWSANTMSGWHFGAYVRQSGGGLYANQSSLVS